MSAARNIGAGPADWVDRVHRAPDGATVRLRKDPRYPAARLAGIRHPAGNPVVVEADRALFSAGRTLESFRQTAADTARLAHRIAGYPGVYPIADQATLHLANCHGLTLRNFLFEDSWPTAVYLQDCSDIRFEGFSIVGSSFAFYAEGKDTARVTLEGCSWRQDPDPDTLWKRTTWKEIHEKYPDDKIDEYNGNRAFDGSFFVGRDIAGDLEVHGCTVEHAFNGIHLFNRRLTPALSRNIHVHGCRFSHIRDNVLEPEDLAYNWWFHDNLLFNCHKWFSFEVPSAGWYYIFRNRAWFDDIGGPPDDGHRGGGIFKLLEDDTRPLRYPGPIEVFNNSWHVTCPIAKKGATARFHHHNNAMTVCGHFKRGARPPCSDPSVFGKLSGASEHFTKHWDELDIRFINDIVLHSDWPTQVIRAGYPLQEAVRDHPGFINPQRGEFVLRKQRASARGAGKVIGVLLPDGTEWRPTRPFNVGWHQDDPSVFAGLRYQRLRDNRPGMLSTRKERA